MTVYYSIPPIITVVSPQNITYPGKVNFNITLDQNGGWCGFSLDGKANVTMSNMSATNFNFTNTTMTNGIHNVVFSCNNTDGAINTSSLMSSFTIDSQSPGLNITYPVNNQIIQQTFQPLIILILI